MPQVTTNNRRMTNIPVGNGDFVQGIRRNQVDDFHGDLSFQEDFNRGVRPLRYTSGLSFLEEKMILHEWNLFSLRFKL